MARVQLRPRRASGTFFHLSPYGPFWVRVLVRVRIVESYVLLPCFPWHACSSVHDGRRERFFTCPRTARSGYVYWSVYGSWNRMCFCPVFHGARQLPSTTAVGQFFPVSSYSPFTAPFKCFCLVIHGARPQPSMKYVKHLFPVSLYSPLMGPCKGLCDELHTLIAEVSWSLASNSFECARDWPYR